MAAELCALGLPVPYSYLTAEFATLVHVFTILEFFHCRKAQIYHHMTRRWQLQSAAERDSSRKEFSPQDRSVQTLWTDTVFWGVRQVCSSAGGGSSEVMFVSVSLFKINLSLEHWRTCHTWDAGCIFLLLLREIAPYLTKCCVHHCNPAREQHSNALLYRCLTVGGDCYFCFPPYASIAVSMISDDDLISSLKNTCRYTP